VLEDGNEESVIPHIFFVSFLDSQRPIRFDYSIRTKTADSQVPYRGETVAAIRAATLEELSDWLDADR